MKYVMLLLVAGGLGLGLFWYLTENAKEERAEAYRREQSKLEQENKDLAKKQAEDKRIRAEEKAAAEKEDATRLFLRYLDREEERLKTASEEAGFKLEKLHIDQCSLSDELIAIENANARRVENAKKRGEKQRDKVEYVLAILKSPVINRLAATYCGEDFTALRSQFQGEIQKIKDVDDVYVKKLESNRKQYDEDVKDADAEVDKKIQVASEKLKHVQGDTAATIIILEKRLAEVRKTVDRLESKREKSTRGGALLTPDEKKQLEKLQLQRESLEAQLSSQKNIADLGSANAAHIEATIAEKRARSKYDSAAIRLRDADTITLTERDHEQDVHNLASIYEDRSLNLVRAAMGEYGRYLSAEITACQKKIAYLHEASANMDFMNAKEVEAMRQKISRRLSENTMSVFEVSK